MASEYGAQGYKKQIIDLIQQRVEQEIREKLERAVRREISYDEVKVTKREVEVFLNQYLKSNGVVDEWHYYSVVEGLDMDKALVLGSEIKTLGEKGYFDIFYKDERINPERVTKIGVEVKRVGEKGIEYYYEKEERECLELRIEEGGVEGLLEDYKDRSKTGDIGMSVSKIREGRGKVQRRMIKGREEVVEYIG